MLITNEIELKQRVGISDIEIAELCQKWNIQKLGLFGSILGSQFRPNSDIDILIKFAPTARQGLLTLARIKTELESRLNRIVDLVTWEGIENSDNWIRRQSILDSVIVIYEQR
ncbi:MAG: nucleotidyltransferase domain-containing protein [Snowella sp.]|nr:nucleotidyltransferase domain-containing protein [Snowella sp.]